MKKVCINNSWKLWHALEASSIITAPILPFHLPQIKKAVNENKFSFFHFGMPDRIRTYDLLLRKQTLYPAELRVLIILIFGVDTATGKFKT